MRRINLLWLLLAVFCGSGIFHTSQKVHDERAKIATLNASIGKEEESLRVLNAEWSYLNQPARLEKLAKTYLHLAPLKGSQFAKVEDIPLRGSADTQTAPIMAEKKPEEKKVAEKKTAKPHIAAAAPLKVKPLHISTPAAEEEDDEEAPAKRKTTVKAASLTKPAANPRSFTDLMKNLRSGVE